jgi:hypothetical protein
MRLSLIALAALAALAGCGDDDVSSRDRARADRLMSYFTDTGQASQWSIESVDVRGGDVTIETKLAPKSANVDSFEAPCTTLVGTYAWVESIEVEGADGEPHVSWTKDSAGCESEGLD